MHFFKALFMKLGVLLGGILEEGLKIWKNGQKYLIRQPFIDKYSTSTFLSEEHKKKPTVESKALLGFRKS